MNATIKNLAHFHLARRTTGAEADLDKIRAAYPDVPLDSVESTEGWLNANPKIQLEVISCNPADPEPIVAADSPEKYPGSTWKDLGDILGPITWAWDNWLPNGFLTMALADQGVGKSVLLLRLAASFLRGDSLPDGTPYPGETGRVLWCEAESSQGLNHQRAEAWGLPVDKIVSPLASPLDDVYLDDAEHMQAIENWMRIPDIRFGVIDSLTGANKRDMNDSRIFHTVKMIADLTKKVQKPIVLSHHTRKLTMLDKQGTITLQQGRGSGAIFQPARCVWGIDTPDPNDEDTRRIALIKNNIVGVRVAKPIGFIVGDRGITFCDAPMTPRKETQQSKAGDLLKTLLRMGRVKATALREEIEGAGLSWNAAKRAKAGLGIVAKKDGVWWWSLPARED